MIPSFLFPHFKAKFITKGIEKKNFFLCNTAAVKDTPLLPRPR